MKISKDINIDICSMNIEDIPSGNKTGGVQITIEGKLNKIDGKNGYSLIHLWLSRKECKELRKIIREKE